MVQEQYYRLQKGDNEKQFGIIMRTRDGVLEEMTGFVPIKELERSSAGTYYEANVNTDGHGRLLLGGEDAMGLLLFKSALEILKQPRNTKISISRISMSQAAKVIDGVNYLRDMEAYIAG